jgi:type IV secretory pathway VirB9-like protein
MESSYFRDAEDGCSELVYSKSQNTWFCGGSMGQLHNYKFEESAFSLKELKTNDSITSLSLSPDENLLAVAIGDHVSIRDVSNNEIEEVDFVARRELPITHVSFNKTGTHL